MKRELDQQLCEAYPKMMVNRHKDMQETAMCWGFACGEGWFNILDQLMGNIQHYLDWKNRESEVVPQVTLDQVKEKFGTLRFYYTGGDEYISGMVTMAESMSGVTCEDCGNHGTRGGQGWIRTICPACDAAREKQRAIQLEQYKEKKHDINYRFVDEDTGHHD